MAGSGSYVAVPQDASGAIGQVGSSLLPHWLNLKSKFVLGLIGGTVVTGIVAGSVAAFTYMPPTAPTSSGPEQIQLSANWAPDSLQTSLSVTWAVPYGESFSGVPPAPTLSPAPPVSNTGLAASNPRVQWGFSADALAFEGPADVARYSYQTPGSNYTSPLLFNATIGCPPWNPDVIDCPGALTPGQKFYYRVGDDTNGWSTVAWSSALPPVGTPGVRLAVLGDLGTTNNSAVTIDHILQNHLNPASQPRGTRGSGSGGKPHGHATRDSSTSGGSSRLALPGNPSGKTLTGETVADVSGAPFSAVLHVGDLSYADQTQGVWDVYGRMLQPVASLIPWMYGVGNHEWFDFAGYKFTSYLSRYRTPSSLASPNDATRLYYSFETGLMHVIMLQGYCPSMSSTGTQPCLAPGSDQMAWLQDDLANVDRAVTPWVIVTFHQPYMNSNTAHAIASEGMPMKKAVEDVLYAAKVDLVFSGHVHAYERNCRAYNFSCVDDGPVYITIGDGGNREGLASTWVQPQPAWSVFRQASYGHGEVTAVNETHLLWQWHQNPDLAPTVADQLWLQKGQPASVGPGMTGEPVFVSKEAEMRSEAAARAYRSTA